MSLLQGVSSDPDNYSKKAIVIAEHKDTTLVCSATFTHFEGDDANPAKPHAFSVSRSCQNEIMCYEPAITIV